MPENMNVNEGNAAPLIAAATSAVMRRSRSVLSMYRNTSWYATAFFFPGAAAAATPGSSPPASSARSLASRPSSPSGLRRVAISVSRVVMKPAQTVTGQAMALSEAHSEAPSPWLVSARCTAKHPGQRGPSACFRGEDAELTSSSRQTARGPFPYIRELPFGTPSTWRARFRSFSPLALPRVPICHATSLGMPGRLAWQRTVSFERCTTPMMDRSTKSSAHLIMRRLTLG